MLVTEKEIEIPRPGSDEDWITTIEKEVKGRLGDNETPIRFVVSNSNEKSLHCELGVLSDGKDVPVPDIPSIFEFRKRSYESADEFNIALVIPTGVGCELGGHSGDAGALARLFGAACDTLITHPNVVNAADINELPENGLYVEGSVLSRLLMGTISLQKVRSNRILVVVDEHSDPMFTELAINSVSAARASLGIYCPAVVRMKNRTIMRALSSSSGRAVGRIENLECLYEVLTKYRDQYDVVALTTLINIPEKYHSEYFKDENSNMVNPWGGVEAMLTHSLSTIFGIQTAHSPMMTSSEVMNLNVGVVDPRKAAEAVSSTYLHCILKGLHGAPRIYNGIHSGLLSSSNISCIVIPDKCIGLPILAAVQQGIAVIAVKDRCCQMNNNLQLLANLNEQIFIVENYLEALGIAMSLKAGLAINSVYRPLQDTYITEFESQSSDRLPISQ